MAKKKQNDKKGASKYLGGMSGRAASLLGGRGRQLDKMLNQAMGESSDKKKSKK